METNITNFAEFWRHAEALLSNTFEMHETKCYFEHVADVDTVLAAAIGRDVNNALRAGKIAEAGAVLSLCEAVLESSHEPVSTIVATGFLEAVWGKQLDSDSRRLVWRMLGPCSRAFCRDWDVWSGIEPAQW